ncbi:MAG TPA: Gfo/Idh/MocA family oxidoreductase [Tepidisphaeraceae bacterium]|nr:Gfo/Idh/MocA family oxidoreductase [Tepidisphaeraceae bacterium]
MQSNANSDFSRRGFLKGSAAIGAAAATLAAMGSNFAHAAGTERIKVGLVGCGGRGTGAARDAIQASPLVDIVAMGDLFKDRLDKSRQALAKEGAQYKVAGDKCFVGFDSFKRVIDAGIDYVILTSPPGFRPEHYAYAIEKNKHVFAEKPVAVDPAGVRRFIESSKLAEQKKLSVVGGFCFRRDATHVETIKRIHDGAIGDVIGGSSYYNVGYLWHHPRQPEWSELEYQCRNWLYYTWLSGDLIVEQNIHRIDIQNWIMKSPPVSAYGMGGRQVRTDPAYGYIYDHFAVEYEYPNGVKIQNMCRQIDGTDPRVSEIYFGTKGRANPAKGLAGERGKKDVPLARAYVQEHVDLINAITSGKLVNEGVQIAESTLSGIMGRMSAYTGKVVTWEQATNSKLDLWPKEPLAFGPIATPPVPMPGKEPLV